MAGSCLPLSLTLTWCRLLFSVAHMVPGKILVWSFTCLAEGCWPSVHHLGQHFSSTHNPARFSKARRPLCLSGHRNESSEFLGDCKCKLEGLATICDFGGHSLVETVGATSWAFGLKPQCSSPARSIDCINQGLCHGFAVARIELGKPIDLELAFCLTLIALCFEIACSLLKMEPSLFLSHHVS